MTAHPPEILCTGVPDQLLDHGQLDSGSSPWDETSYGQDCGHRYSLPCIACKNSGNWNGSVLNWRLIFLLSYKYLPQKLEGILFQSPLLLHGQLAMV